MTVHEENPRPTLDLVFRKLFGSEENKDLLISLINSIVEPGMYLSDAIIKNPFNLAEYVGSKESIVDIKARDQDGTWYTIEMQLHGHVFYGKRAIYYAAKGYVDQLDAGRDYAGLNTSIGIHFLGFELFRDERLVRQFVFKDAETNEHPRELQHIQLYFVEMGKFRKNLAEIDTALDRWIAFMTKGVELRANNLPATLQAEPAIAKAVAELERMGADPELREIYEAEEKARMADVAELQYAEERGIEQGMQRGRQHLLHRLMTRHIGEVPPNITARLDALTPNQLDELGDVLFDLTSYAEVEAWLSGQ